MSQRVDYDPDDWQPGDPIYVAPRNHAEGNHRRQMVQEIDTNEGPDCNCPDRAIWPVPRDCHDLATNVALTIPGLPFHSEQVKDTDAA